MYACFLRATPGSSDGVPMFTASMMSISPDAAHVPYAESVGSIQIAGHAPCPCGRRARISKRPNVHSCRFLVRSRAEV